MSLSFSDLDLSGVSENSALGVGVHVVTITDAMFGPMSPGERPVVELQLNSGGATFTDRLRVYSESEVGARISQQRLKAYLVATDFHNPDRPEDIAWFKGKRVKVKIEPGKAFVRDDGSTGNYKNVTGVYAADAQVSESIAPATAPALAAASSGNDFDDAIPF